MAYQTLYNKTINFAAMSSTIGALGRLFLKSGNMFLDAPAAKQLLKAHVYTKSGAGLHKNYTAHWRRANFLSYFADPVIPNYPEFAKKVSIATGSFNGIKQRNFYTDLERVAGDYFIDSKAETYGRFLGIKVPLFGYDLELKSNTPTGHFFKMNAGSYRPGIKLYWFGIKVTWGYNSLLASTEYGNLNKHNTDAGGYYPEANGWFNSGSAKSYSLSPHYAFNLFQYSFSNSNGCVNLNSHVGLNGILSANLDYQTCTDGIQFGFVPTSSAFDFAGSPRNPDVNSQTLTYWLNKTPFDALISSINPYVFENPNRFHRDFNNYPIQSGENEYHILENCIYGEDRDTVRLINREIGEETVYIDNLTLNRPAEFKALFDLYVNVFNPFYKYVTNPNPHETDGQVAGTYSKSSILQSVPNAVNGQQYAVSFIKGAGSSSTGRGFEYQPDEVDLWTIELNVFESCCINYYQKREIIEPNLFLKTSPTVSIYPNPVVENRFKTTLNLDTVSDFISLQLFNSVGKSFYYKRFEGPFKDEVHINTIISKQLAPGLYNLQIKTSQQAFSRKLIINH
jgi:hypothetical protein